MKIKIPFSVGQIVDLISGILNVKNEPYKFSESSIFFLTLKKIALIKKKTKFFPHI
jgi:hypothetical protein